MRKKLEAGAALLLTMLAIGFAARFFGRAGPLWRDEAATLNFATQPALHDLVRSLDFMSLPLLYPALVRAWFVAGWVDPDLAARLLGLVVTVALIATPWLATRWLRLGPPLLTLAFFALHGVVLATAALVRPYGLGALAVMAACYAMLGLALAPSGRTFAVAAFLATLAVQLQYQNTLFIAAICLAGALAAIAARGWKAALLPVAAGAMAAVSLLPYVPVVTQGEEWRALHRSPGDAPFASVLQHLSDLITLQNSGLLVLWLCTLALVCYAGGRSILASRGEPGERPTLIYAMVTLFGGLAVFALFFESAGRIVQPWHVVPLIALLAPSLDLLLAGPALWPQTRLVLASAAAILLVPAALALTDVRQTNVDLYAGYLEQRARPQDLIVVNPWFVGITLDRYYHGKARRMTIPPIGDLRIHRYDELRARMMEREPLRPLEEAITSALQAGHRVWVIGDLPMTSPKPPPLPPAPHPVTGWSDTTYAIGWSTQIGNFLQARAERAYRVQLSAGRRINPFENVQMLMLEGWRR